MSLSKFYDKQYSNMKILTDFKFFGKSKNNEQDLNDLLKDDPNDFNDEAAGVVEKNSISYANSLHTTHLQRGRFVRIDDNLLNIELMNSEARGKSKQKSTIAKPLTDNQIKEFKNEIRRVQIKYLKKADVQAKRQYMLNSKIEFATKMFNLKEKGVKLMDLMMFSNKCIRERGVNSKQDIDFIQTKMNDKRLELDFKICKKQVERLQDIRNDFCDVEKFEHSSMMIDKEIEYLILYYTPSVKRNNDELGTVMTKVIANEKILSKR